MIYSMTEQQLYAAYNRWKTLQKAYPSHLAMQKTTIWGLGQLCVYRTPRTSIVTKESTLPVMKFRNGLIKMTHTGISTCFTTPLLPG